MVESQVREVRERRERGGAGSDSKVDLLKTRCFRSMERACALLPRTSREERARQEKRRSVVFFRKADDVEENWVLILHFVLVRRPPSVLVSANVELVLRVQRLLVRSWEGEKRTTHLDLLDGALRGLGTVSVGLGRFVGGLLRGRLSALRLESRGGGFVLVGRCKMRKVTVSSDD
jgi:hypothetical protein